MSDKNADKELNSIFERLFNDKNECIFASSPLCEKLQNIEVNNFINEFVSLQNEIRKTIKNLPVMIENRKALLQQKLYHVDYMVNDNAPIRGKYFTITNLLGAKTLVFTVYQEVDYHNKITHYSQQSKIYAEEYTADRRLKQTFFIDEPENNQSIVIISLQPNKNRVFLNMGCIPPNNRVCMGTPITISCAYNSPDKPIINPSTHQLDSDINESISVNTEKLYEADIDGNVVLIDVQSFELLLREVYFDNETLTWKARIKLDPSKCYIAFRIHPAGEPFIRTLTPLEQGKFYYHGVYNFPCDKLKAAYYLEEDGSSEANYYVANIFINDSEYQDINLGLDYLVKSAKQGFLAAQVDLAIYYYYNHTKNVQEIISLIRLSLEHEYAPAQFIAAYAYETGTLVKRNLKLAFQLYLKAAENSYAPALLRLSPETDDKDFSEDQLYYKYEKNVDTVDGKAYTIYCLGRALIGKVYVESYHDGLEWSNDNYLHINSKQGFQLIQDAADMNCIDAIFDMAFAYDFGEFGVEPNKLQAFNFYIKIAHLSEDITLRIIDWLINDDIYCGQNIDANAEAFSLLNKLLDNGLGKGKTFNKLGELFFHGIGCEQDYKTAKELFESAGIGDSFYNLGYMYENGLGVKSNMQLAKQYYEKGAKLENESCIQKCDELSQKKITIFLSYAHADSNIADIVDDLLRFYGYDVKRDIRDIKTWNNLKQFMRSIREQNYAVLLVSDSYLRSDNCMYEITQLLKNNSCEDRVLPIVVEYPEEIKSMFSLEYRAEIILFWQERANELYKSIKKLNRENSSEMDSKYREIKMMAQNVSEFMDKFFNNKLLASMENDNTSIENAIKQVNENILEHLQAE